MAVLDMRMGARWSRKEDEDLSEFAINYRQNWDQIAQYFDKRSAIMCENRWNQVISLGLMKGKWSLEEDTIITDSVNQGVTKWSEIAKKLPVNRIGKQCRERYFNHLDPALKKTIWTVEEDAAMFRAQKKIGNSWTKIAQEIPGRSENDVKNRYNSILRRRKHALLHDKSSRADEIDEEKKGQTEREQGQKIRVIGSTMSKRMLNNSETPVIRKSQKLTNSGHSSIPEGCSIISLLSDDVKALQIAERLLCDITLIESSKSPLYLDQLLSYLSGSLTCEFSATFSLLTLVPIMNASAHNKTPNEDESTKPSKSFRVHTGHSTSNMRRPAIERILWAPTANLSESSPSSLVNWTSLSTGAGVSGNNLDRRDYLSASLPVESENDSKNNTFRKPVQFQDQGNHIKTKAVDCIEEEDSSTDTIKYSAQQLLEIETLSPVSDNSKLGDNSPCWDDFSPINSTPPLSALSSTPFKKSMFLNVPERASLSDNFVLQNLTSPSSYSSLSFADMELQNLTRTSSCSNLSDSKGQEADMIIEALRMLSGNSFKSGVKKSSSASNGIQNIYDENDDITDFMSTISLRSTPWSSRPPSPLLSPEECK